MSAQRKFDLFRYRLRLNDDFGSELQQKERRHTQSCMWMERCPCVMRNYAEAGLSLRALYYKTLNVLSLNITEGQRGAPLFRRSPGGERTQSPASGCGHIPKESRCVLTTRQSEVNRKYAALKSHLINKTSSKGLNTHLERYVYL